MKEPGTIFFKNLCYVCLVGVIAFGLITIVGSNGGDDGDGDGGDTEAPTAPTELTATAASSSQIDLTWTASTDNVGVTCYKVFRDETEIATPTSTSYSDTGLSASTQYCYTVKAYDAAGNVSAASNEACATTPPETVDGNDYYPIDVGNVWNYNIANVEVIDEQHTFTDGIGQRVNTTPIPGSDVDVGFLENMINDGVVFLGTYDVSEGFEDDPIDGLFVILKNIMAVGDTWNLEFFAPSSSFMTVTFLGLETVTVPAGSFADCIKIEFAFNDDEEPYTDHAYFAKDVGLVKAERISPPGHTDGWFLLVTSDDRLVELQSATIDGISYP